jgi:hypothetical protein
MQAIEMAGSWMASGSLHQYVPDVPGWRENWLGILFVIVGTLLLISGWRQYLGQTARNFWNSMFVYDTKQEQPDTD